ncbi:MAG: prepilin peptidase [Candidatus Roizmanbacteria bacterium]
MPNPLFILEYTFIFIIGLFIGSFLNVLADRLSNEETLRGRSHCDSCKHILGIFDLIPLFSFLFLKGKCRYCKKKFSWVYPFIELFTGVFFALTWYFTPLPTFTSALYDITQQTTLFSSPLLIVQRLIYLIITSILIVIFFADIKYQIIPDEMQISFIIASFFLHITQHPSFQFFGIQILSGLGVMTPILLIYLFTKGRGMGFGDVKFAFGMGFLLGIISGLFALYIAFITGAIIGVGLIFFGNKKLKSKIAFGPFLIIGVVVMFFGGSPILTFLKSIYGF